MNDERNIAQTREGPRLVRPAKQVGSGLDVRQFKILNGSDFGDYLLCQSWKGGQLGNEVIKVAKPYKLRRTPFDGQTHNGISWSYTSNVQRTATQGNKTETQVIVPAYRDISSSVADIIYAGRGVAGGTEVVDEVGKDVVWLDLNGDGRAWAKKKT